MEEVKRLEGKIPPAVGTFQGKKSELAEFRRSAVLVSFQFGQNVCVIGQGSNGFPAEAVDEDGHAALGKAAFYEPDRKIDHREHFAHKALQRDLGLEVLGLKENIGQSLRFLFGLRQGDIEGQKRIIPVFLSWVERSKLKGL